MNETGMSGNDLCEQPVLTWVELRALAGLALGAAILVATGHAGTPNEYSQAAAVQIPIPTITPPLEETHTIPVEAEHHPDTSETPEVLELFD